MSKLLLCAAAFLLAAMGSAWAANGCGPGYFRTITGECVPNARVPVGPGRAVVLPPPCPRGFRRDPDPRRPICYPVF